MPDSPNQSRPEPQPQIEPSPQLNYIGPRDDLERANRETFRARIAALASAIAVLFLVFYWIGSNLWVHPPPRRPPLNYLGPTIATGIAVLALGGTGLWYYIRDGSTAFCKGILMGIGIAVLIEGLCFGLKFREFWP